MQQEQDLTRPSKGPKQGHESDQAAALEPAGAVLAGLSRPVAPGLLLRGRQSSLAFCDLGASVQESEQAFRAARGAVLCPEPLPDPWASSAYHRMGCHAGLGPCRSCRCHWTTQP
eukprot:g75008.t1